MNNNSKEARCEDRIEKLMDRVLDAINNRVVEFHTIADRSEKRILTTAEAQLIRNAMQMYKSLIKQLFLEAITGLAK